MLSLCFENKLRFLWFLCFEVCFNVSMEGSIDRIGNMVKCEVIEEKVYVKVMKL